MKLKVCGMKQNVEAVASLNPAYLGFIFYDKSPRNFNGDIPEMPDSIKKVGVFVDSELAEVVEKVAEYGLNMVQLHGGESPEYCTKLKSHIEQGEKSRDEISQSLHSFRNDSSVEIIKVFSIKDEFDFTVLEPYEPVCDYFLFDTKGALPGGNGYAFDWSVLDGYPSNKPFFLSGGIGMNELEKLQEFSKSDASRFCHAIDVNSRFEIEPGLKHIEELEKFKNNVITRNEIPK